MTTDILVATDIEANGPIPGHFSMLSFGSVAVAQDKTILSTFARNLEVLPGAVEHPETMAWWRTQPEAWRACRKNLVAPQLAMTDYAVWLDSLPGKPLFVAFPVAFDYAFIAWYLWAFAGRDPFQRRCLDGPSFAAAMLDLPTYIPRDAMSPAWFDADFVHNHEALDDAMGYAMLICNMIAANRRQRKSERV